MTPYKPVMLIILDGWGIREMEHGNAVLLGKTPNYDRWTRQLERSIVDTSGESVGLVPDQMGNSEVGHLNLGSGRVVYQDISRIDIAIKNGTLAQRPPLVEAIQKVKASGKKLHLVGLLGPGGVHSHESHLFALLDVCQQNGVDPVIHVITDGRDTPPDSGIGFLARLQAKMDSAGVGRIATVSGRYYAMDRDKRWERTAKAFDAMVWRKGLHAATAREAIQQSYDSGVTDEFIVPTVVGDDPALRVEAGDALVFYNFRADRMRQIVQAFARREFEGASHFTYLDDLYIATFTEYMEDLPVQVLFPMELLTNTLAEWLSKHGLKQYHSAETEKYPHVTFFFNGRNEDPFPGEDRAIIPSPKVATYDLKPEMSAYELTAAMLKRLETHDDDFILINFANPDMVGHTGVLAAAVKAVEAVDECAGRLVEAVLKKGGAAIVTADHGNCERMIDENTGHPHTYHTVGPVALFVIGDGYFGLHSRGILADVAPTVLDLMGLAKPPEMTGRSLIQTKPEDVKPHQD
ncbi:MAG: 2,3-bisphosphoglycerate-independent phosphoglycerate mutase [Chloroflexota bacterium]|nr:MAG: 2,3-bisphosphoglycerate-independent phosphoglycerate mutase [Chloroflexota bacterium]